MRASISVPGVYAPVRMGDRLLVDGGLTNNIPIDVVSAMGADVMIVVAFTTSLLPTKKIGLVLNVLSQTVSMLVLFNERVQLASLKVGDVLVMVYTGKLGTTDFERGQALMVLGRQTLLTQSQAIKPLQKTGRCGRLRRYRWPRWWRLCGWKTTPSWPTRWSANRWQPGGSAAGRANGGQVVLFSPALCGVA